MISINRLDNEFPDRIEKCQRKIPNMKDPDSRIWIEDWMPGQEMDPTNIEHLGKSLLWLIDFQKQSRINELSKAEKQNEVAWFKQKILNFPEINNKKYLKWLDNYEEYILKNKIYKVARHGDFWYTNILIDKKTNQTNQAINNQLNKDNGLHSMNNNNGMFYKTKIKSITPSLNSQINDKENQYYY